MFPGLLGWGWGRGVRPVLHVHGIFVQLVTESGRGRVTVFCAVLAWDDGEVNARAIIWKGQGETLM